jgi:hypothetical protein
MGAFRTIIYIIGAGAVLGITFAFFWVIGLYNTQYADTTGATIEVVTYVSTVWMMSGILAGLIVFAAIAKDHSQLEILSSLSFLIYTLFAYIIGCSILSFFIPYNGFGSLNLNLIITLTSSNVKIDVNVIYLNIVAALLILLLQALRFLKTMFKAAKTMQEVPDTKKESSKSK